MGKGKNQPNKSPTDTATADDASIADKEKQDSARRLQDSVVARESSRKLNLERRLPSVERRSDINPNYKGPVRRYKLDSRENNKDRRDED